MKYSTTFLIVLLLILSSLCDSSFADDSKSQIQVSDSIQQKDHYSFLYSRMLLCSSYYTLLTAVAPRHGLDHKISEFMSNSIRFRWAAKYPLLLARGPTSKKDIDLIINEALRMSASVLDADVDRMDSKGLNDISAILDRDCVPLKPHLDSYIKSYQSVNE